VPLLDLDSCSVCGEKFEWVHDLSFPVPRHKPFCSAGRPLTVEDIDRMKEMMEKWAASLPPAFGDIE